MWLRIVTDSGPVLLNSDTLEDVCIHERQHQFIVGLYAARASGQESWCISCGTRRDAELIFDLLANRLAACTIGSSLLTPTKRNGIPTDQMTTEALNLWEAIEYEDHEAAQTFFANSNGPTVASTIAEVLAAEEGPSLAKVTEFLLDCYGM